MHPIMSFSKRTIVSLVVAVLLSLGAVAQAAATLRGAPTNTNKSDAAAAVKSYFENRGKNKRSIKLRRLRNQYVQNAPTWFLPYRREYGREVDLCVHLIKSKDSKWYNENPSTGDICKIKKRKTGGYWCGYGEQTCPVAGLPDITSHPERKCVCDYSTGQFQCDPYDPCDTPEAPPSPPEITNDVEPQTPDTIATIDDDFARCGAYTGCRDCLADGCGWVIGRCMPDCGLIADAACYQGDAEAKCSDMEAAELDSKTCSAASADCSTCTSTMKPSSDTPCLWLDYGSGTPSCASFCGMLGCGNTNGHCLEDVITLIEPIAVDGRPFTDREGTTKMAEAVESDFQPTLWSASSSSAIDNSRMLTQDQRLQLAEEWKRRAVGEHSSIASFAAFSIALMTNRAPPDLVQASLVAAMDELRHAQVSFEMASMLSGSTIEPSALPASQHDFQENLASLAFGVAKEGCVDETLSALVLAESVDQIQQGIDAADPTMQLLAEKTTQIAKEEGNHSVLAWRTIYWVCSMDGEKACDSVLNDFFNSSQLESSGEARLGSSKSSVDAWRFIYKQLVPLVTKSDDGSFEQEGEIRFEEGSLVASLAIDIVNGVRTAIATMTTTASESDGVQICFPSSSSSSPTVTNCSDTLSEETRAAPRMDSSASHAYTTASA